jgi:phenol hydroxylase P1 protein
MNNASVCAYSYGAGFSQPHIYQAMDQLGIAQYITRVGLLLGDVESLDEAKRAWMEDDTWQGLRRFVEDSFVVKDPVELFAVQNVVLDGLMYPLVYDTIIDDVLSSQGGTPVAMLTQFMTDWFGETKKWADATVKIAAAESPENKQILAQWLSAWRDRAAAALLPVARIALGDRTDEVMAEIVQQFNARMAKAGVAI